MSTEEKNTSLSQAMRQHISLWEASNQSIREYCADKDFTMHKLNYWRYKLQKEQKGNTATLVGFTRVVPEVSPAVASQDIPTLEVSLSNGNRLVFYQDISRDLLKIFL
jgi:hypothetical protein